MKNTINKQTRAGIAVWLVAMVFYALAVLAFWKVEPLRKSTFSVAEAKQQAEAQKEQRAKAKRTAKPPKEKKIPPREIEKIGKELARKKSKQIRKRTERVEDVSEKLNELAERAETAYHGDREAEEELYLRIGGLIRAMDTSAQESNLPVCAKLVKLSVELASARQEKNGGETAIMLNIGKENDKVRPVFRHVKDPQRRGRLLWQSKELERLLSAGASGDFAAALKLGDEDVAKNPEKLPEGKEDSALVLQAELNEKENKLDAGFAAIKSLEEAAVTGKALDEVMDDSQLNQLAAKEIAEAMLDDAKQSAETAQTTAAAAAELANAQTQTPDGTGSNPDANANANADATADANANTDNANAAPPSPQAALNQVQAAATDAQSALNQAQAALDAGRIEESKLHSQNAAAAAAKAQAALQQMRSPDAPATPNDPNAAANNQPQINSALPDTRDQLRQFSSKYNDLSNRAAQMASKANSLARQSGLPSPANPNEGAISGAKFTALQNARNAIGGAVAAMNGNNGKAGAAGQRMMLDLSGAMRSMSGMGIDSGNTHNDGFYSHSDYGEPSQPKQKPFSNTFSDKEIIRQSLPGRRLYPNAKRKGWLFIDSWYVIGPWGAPGPETQDLPVEEPERKIDLDAEYIGKKKKNSSERYKLRWRYLQTDTVNVRLYDQVGDAFYYAYSEIWAAEGMDVTLLIGSDDAAKIWINDVVVWNDLGLSPWSLSEGVVRVYLKKGYNKILVKIHNFPNVCLFSIAFAPSQEK